MLCVSDFFLMLLVKFLGISEFMVFLAGISLTQKLVFTLKFLIWQYVISLNNIFSQGFKNKVNN